MTCPVLGACREYVIKTGTTDGVWAGQTAAQIKKNNQKS